MLAFVFKWSTFFNSIVKKVITDFIYSCLIHLKKLHLLEKGFVNRDLYNSFLHSF